jgi:hypothetical protein
MILDSCGVVSATQSLRLSSTLAPGSQRCAAEAILHTHDEPVLPWSQLAPVMAPLHCHQERLALTIHRQAISFQLMHTRIERDSTESKRTGQFSLHPGSKRFWHPSIKHFSIYILIRTAVIQLVLFGAL